MGKLFFTADLHLSHSNIIKHCKRPFESVADMNLSIVANWNHTISQNDTVYILGDAGQSATALLRSLNGKKFLIPGNHDRIKKDSLYNIFEILPEISILRLEGYPEIVMCHYPLLEWPGYFRGAVHLFGHVHGKLNTTVSPRALDVGVDCSEFYPLSIEKVFERFERKRLDLQL